MKPIDIPDFCAMTDDDLHAWEFKVYEAVPGDSELYEIIGVEKAREYYNERGKRLDMSELDKIKAEHERLEAKLREIATRLQIGTSGQFHFHRHWPLESQ